MPHNSTESSDVIKLKIYNPNSLKPKIGFAFRSCTVGKMRSIMLPSAPLKRSKLHNISLIFILFSISAISYVSKIFILYEMFN